MILIPFFQPTIQLGYSGLETGVGTVWHCVSCRSAALRRYFRNF